MKSKRIVSRDNIGTKAWGRWRAHLTVTLAAGRLAIAVVIFTKLAGRGAVI
ncbi:hypothetical protein [Sinorhizobium alkalisoli]|uniref:hypothetical protein n=1 Tax=Sinorhizobium alkalisoli TaxID=1752398 RepID=UPI0012A7FA0B|nr:hypothetical protein [Sinorhizobium alkalisoli]MCG5478309.1 hypothetical protein [Sinorhizobium alkalisoli]QFI66252.1 hypothetical protein EKH55_1378 [Sinorhizobium alkalisoli]